MRAAFLAGIALALLTLADAGGGVPPSQGEVVFAFEQVASADRARTQSDVYLARPGSKKRQRLAWGPADEVEPALSPDRKLLAFVRIEGAMPDDEESGVHNVLVKRLADGKLFRLGHGGSPSWSPDGLRLAILTKRGIETIRPDGRERRLVVAGRVWSVSWSAGVLVYAFGPKNVTPRIWTARPDGTRKRDLGLEGIEPTLSPDGKLVAYTDLHNLWVASADGDGARELTHHDLDRDQLNVDVHPTWSPDGARIAFASGSSLWELYNIGVHGDAIEPEPAAIMAMRPSGGTPVLLVSTAAGPGADFQPSWHR